MLVFDVDAVVHCLLMCVDFSFVSCSTLFIAVHYCRLRLLVACCCFHFFPHPEIRGILFLLLRTHRFPREFMPFVYLQAVTHHRRSHRKRPLVVTIHHNDRSPQTIIYRKTAAEKRTFTPNISSPSIFCSIWSLFLSLFLTIFASLCLCLRIASRTFCLIFGCGKSYGLPSPLVPVMS